MASSPRYTHGHAESVLRSHRTRTAQNSAAYLLPFLKSGQSFLDVGSGPGTITADLAGLVAPGRLTALEMSEGAIALTRSELEGRGIRNVEFVVGDVLALDLPDDTFDVVHAHQVLQHVADPVQALREMTRVTKRGGLVAARDADYSGFVWYPELPALDRWRELYEAAARANGGEPNAGRRMLAWALAAGAARENVTATSSTWCYSDDEGRQQWGPMWADRITSSAIAEQLVSSGMASESELVEIADAWNSWTQTSDGWLSVLHGEILIRV